MDSYFAVVVLLAFFSGVFLTLGALERQDRQARKEPVGPAINYVRTLTFTPGPLLRVNAGST